MQRQQYICIMMFANEGNIESRFASKEMEIFPERLNNLSTQEKKVALSNAALRMLEPLQSPPDEYGYPPADAASKDLIAFLEVLDNGDLYLQWDLENPDPQNAHQ